jgi:hypothetical protein
MKESKPIILSGHILCSTDKTLVSVNLNEELQTVFVAVIRIVNYVKNSPLKGRHFAKLCDDMEAEHIVLLYYYETHWLFHAKEFHRFLT